MASGKIITVTDAGGYLPKNPDEWPEQLKREIRECCCGASTSRPAIPNTNNPIYPVTCCPNGQAVNLSSVLLMNHGGSVSHDRGMTLRKWPGGVNSNPVPWIPEEAQWDNANTGTVGNVYDAWYSDWFDDFDSGPINLFQTITQWPYKTDFYWSYRDQWWKRYGAFYALPFPGAFRACAGFWNTYFRRTGTVTRVTTNLQFGTIGTDVFRNDYPAALPNGRRGYVMNAPAAGGQECSFAVGGLVGCNAHATITRCPNYYAKGYLYQGYNPEYSGIVASLPTYAAGPGFINGLQWVDGSWLIEPNAWCVGNLNGTPIHSPYLEVMDAAGTPFDIPWVPPS